MDHDAATRSGLSCSTEGVKTLKREGKTQHSPTNSGGVDKRREVHSQTQSPLSAPWIWGWRTAAIAAVERSKIRSCLFRMNQKAGLSDAMGLHHTWLGSGSTSSQLSVRSPHGTGVKGLCFTDGRIRYSQLQRIKSLQLKIKVYRLVCLFVWSTSQTSSYWLDVGR